MFDQNKKEERGRNGPDGSPPQLHAEETHAEHGEKVIKTEDGVGEAAGKTVPVEADMGPGASRKKEKSQGQEPTRRSHRFSK